MPILLKKANRIINRYGDGNRGPIFICLCGVHGNELAGPKAVKKVFNYLQVNHPTFKGEFIGIEGNTPALKLQQRFIHTDLNRLWTDERIQKVKETPNALLNNEEIQQKELMELFDQLLIDTEDREVLLMDIHTTSAEGEIPFIVTNSNPYSIKIALQLGIPVIKEVNKVLSGTTLQYFGNQYISAFGIEAGQHDDPASVKRVEAAIWTSLVGAGCMTESDINRLTEKRNFLRKTSKQVPSLVHFTYRYPVVPSDNYETLPGFKNFDPITKGQQIAQNNGNPVLAPHDGYLLMPLYQKQGEDGFFIVNEDQ